MAVHKLILDDIFEKADGSLIAIHCNIEAYRLAFLLNKQLHLSLARRKKNLDFSVTQSSYPIFEWEDTKHLVTWSLVANTCKTEVIKQNNLNSLFDTEEKVTKTMYLIPEHKTVNFLLKTDHKFILNKEKQILKTILEIPQIATAYSIEINALKSKDNLIFS